MAEISTSRPITAAQVRAIHIALSRNGIDDDVYRGMLRNLFDGAGSCKELSRAQASRLLDALGCKLRHAPGTHRRREKRPRPKPAANGITALPTPAQRELIAELVRELGWSDAHYRGWLDKFMGVSRIATRGDASHAIEGLKIVSRRQAGGPHG